MASSTSDAQRAELHKTIWAIADELRGSVDGWDFKQYVLGMLFYRFISENLCDYLNEQERTRIGCDAAFDYAQLPDEQAEYSREAIVLDKGFFILSSELFCNVRARARTDENLNETLERVFKHIEGIVGALGAREPEEHFCSIVACDDVLANDANLSVSSYVEQPEAREEVDIAALNAEIARIVEREQELRERIDRIVADLEG